MEEGGVQREPELKSSTAILVSVGLDLTVKSRLQSSLRPLG